MRTRAPQERVPWPRIVALLASIAQKASCTSFLAAVLRGMPAEARGSHGQPTDAAGCAAMPCEEVVVHGYDIARGFGVACTPPPDLARHVRDRLFPWPPAGDPWTTLLWCNGRMALPDYERLTDWSGHPAPLSAWDGTRRRERCTGEGWFTEGFDMADLLEAKALLAELAG
jgi:hypothetical protein